MVHRGHNPRPSGIKTVDELIKEGSAKKMRTRAKELEKLGFDKLPRSLIFAAREVERSKRADKRANRNHEED